MAAENVNNSPRFEEECLRKVFFENKKPDFWDEANDKVTYRDMSHFFSFIDKFFLSDTSIISVLRLLSPADSDISAKIKIPTNLRKKVSTFLKKNVNTSKIDLPVEMLYQIPNSIGFIGPICESISLTRADLDNLHGFFLQKNIVLTNGIVLEIKKGTNLQWDELHKMFLPFGKDCDVSLRAFKYRVEVLLSKAKEKQSKKDLLKEFLSQEFKFFSTKKASSPVVLNVTQKSEEDNSDKVFDLLEKVDYLESKTQDLLQCLQEETHDKANISIQLRKIKQDRQDLSKKLDEAMIKLGNLSKRNVNKRIKRKKEENKTLLKKLKEKEEENEDLQDSLDKLDSRLRKTLKSNARFRKSLCIWKKKARNLIDEANAKEETVFQSYVQDLKDQIEFLEDEKSKLEEKIKSFLEDGEVQVFKDGKYSDEIRQVYEDLLCYGLGSRNIESVIRTVMGKLAGIEVGRLPKPSFAKYMLLEARALAQLQIADELTGGDTDIAVDSNNTLHSDGTSKQRRSFMTYDINTQSGKNLVLGLRESATSDAQTQLDVFVEVLNDIGQLNNNSKFVNQTIVSIKNLMSDRCNTQKCFNNIFITLRETIIPKVVELWECLNEEDRQSLSKVNEFFCGLHFLVALADQADASLKIWEILCFPDGKVGAKQFSTFQKASNSGESGTTRTVRTSCKLVQTTQGCQKSGKMLKFSTWLKEEKGLENVPLYPFLGNRFNILFLNGGGLFKIYDHLVEFLEGLDKDNENQLVIAVKRDLKVRNFKVGCRALGLINKLITGPLWRKMAEEKSAISMSEHYQHMYECFKKWADNPDDFIQGKDSLFDNLLHKDDIFEALIEPNKTDFDLLKQLLSIIFGAFVMISERMLYDHLHGTYKSPSAQLVDEAKNVPTTNAAAERDFGVLDRLMKTKPKALDIVYEGIIMYTTNHTKEWRDKLSPSRLSEVMKVARMSKTKQRADFFERKKKIHEKRAENLKIMAEEKERKELKLIADKETLTVSIQQYGGLWTDIKQLDAALEKLDTDKLKREALKCQLQFRKKVINSNAEKSLFYMTVDSKNKPVEEVRENLIKVIDWKIPEPTDESDEIDFSTPVILENDLVQQEKKKFLDAAKETKETHSKKKFSKKDDLSKVGKQSTSQTLQQEKIPMKRKNTVGNKSKSTKTISSKKKKTDLSGENNVPIISSPSDLLGKLVEHYTDRVISGQDEIAWHKGLVHEIKGGSKKSPKFLIQYVLEDDEGVDLSVCPLYEDFKNNELKLVEVTPVDFENDIEIECLYEDETGQETWWKGQVDGIADDGDPKNPNFYVYYKDTKTDIYECFDEPLVQNYLKGYVRFKDLPKL